MIDEPQKPFEGLIKPLHSMRDRKLIEKRFEHEFNVATKQQVRRESARPPELPDAQLVYSDAGHLGVAIRGAKYVCTLPPGYGGPLMELGLIHGNAIVVSQPDKPPLVINPETGSVTRL